MPPRSPVPRLISCIAILLLFTGLPALHAGPDARMASPFPDDITIRGTVTDETGEPLPGVNVLLQGSAVGTITDVDGFYELEVPDDATALVFSYVGYITQEVPIDGRTEIDVRLDPNIEALSEVVVVGYGTVKKSDLTGSVASIKNEEITKVTSARLDDALRGKVSGLQIVPTSAAPGAAATIRIRGSNSISANNEPLVVVDGFIGGVNLNDINLNDVESVEVLKDASATALYGSRGSNGVILITTKRGQTGQTLVTYDGYAGFQTPLEFLPMLNAAEYGDWINEVQGGANPVYPDPPSLGEGTDWQEEVYRDDALIMSHTLSVSGGNEKTRFFLSGNYFDQEGLFVASDFQRYQFRLNTDHAISDRLKLGNSLTFSRVSENPRSANIINVAGWNPTLPVFDENGDYTIQTISSELSPDNPVSVAQQTTNQNTSSRLLGNFFADWEFLPGLTYRLNFGLSLENFRNEFYAPSTLESQAGDQGTASIRHRETLDLLIENTLNYNRRFGEHEINALAGYTRQRIFTKESFVQTLDYVTDAFTFNNLAAGVVRSGASSDATETGLESFLFRVNYSFRDRYLFTLSARADGSSVFAENNKWAIFPSAAFAWRVIEEPFMQDQTLFDDLKFRVSYGRVGNPGLGFGASLTRLATGGNNYILGTNQDVVSGIAANSLGNDNLRWESTDQLDIGVDMSFFNYRLSVTLDYYNKTTNDLLVNVEIPWLTGFSSSLSNFGQVANRGVELSLNSVNIDSRDFRWETNFNIARNVNEVLDIRNEEGFIFINPIGGVEAVISGILQEGEPIGTFYGMVREGIWNSEAEIEEAGVTGFSVFPGGKRFADLNGDGVISAVDDRQIIGDANPDFFGGIGNNLSYKGIDFSFYFSFMVGNDIFNETDSRVGVAFDNNTFARFADRWSPENPDSNVPSADGADRTLITSDTEVVENGGFLRLRNISLGYNFPVSSVAWLQNARLYISALNLWTLDSYSGYDPEVNRGFDNLRRGYDQAQYPSAKTFTAGLTLNF